MGANREEDLLIFKINDNMHLKYQLHLEPTAAAPVVDCGFKDKKKKKDTFNALSTLVVVASLCCARTTTWCLYLLYGFKIKGVSIKVNHVQFKVTPCQQNVHILLYTCVCFESWSQMTTRWQSKPMKWGRSLLCKDEGLTLLDLERSHSVSHWF